MKSTFKELTAISIDDKLKSKGGFSYLSWAYAWAIVKDKYPDSTRKVYESEHTGLNYFTDGKTAYVKVGVTINGVEHIDYLPVMDNRNNSIPIAKLTSFDVNNSIQRSNTKALARHGLGMYVYQGESLPTVEVKANQAAEIEKAEQEAKDQNLVNQYIQKLDKALSDFDPSAVQEVFSEIADDNDRLKSRVYNGLQGDVKEFVTESMTNEEAA